MDQNKIIVTSFGEAIKALGYEDLAIVDVCSEFEKLVSLADYDKSIICSYEKMEEPPGLKGRMLIRESVAKKISQVSKALKNYNNNLTLKVVYAFRPLSVQKEYFEKERERILKQRSFDNSIDLLKEIHKFIAAPFVAGHPTGGAVDVTIFDELSGKNCDMGSVICDFDDEENIRWDADLNEEQTANRKLLFELMTKEGFAPFYGEWWHFSYGDKEWAAYYDKPYAIFDGVNVY